jgi:predicted Rossmann fold flavoprotein
MIVVIGGGPAGFFAAITARENDPGRPVVLIEKSGRCLRKVAISGGGRCNVTHACFDPRELAGHYPRGRRELIGPFTRWSAGDTVAWFTERGVRLKTEPDGRMFPVTDRSETIVECLLKAARDSGVQIMTRREVTLVAPAAAGGFTVDLRDGDRLTCRQVVLAAGGRTSDPQGTGGYRIAQSLGHDIAPPVPSLFTFKISDPLLDGMAGVSMPDARIRLLTDDDRDPALEQEGPVLITHWGLSGPAVLKLSAWGARALAETRYRCEISVCWLKDATCATLNDHLRQWGDTHGKQQIAVSCPVDLPRRLWTALVRKAGVDEPARWAECGRDLRAALVSTLLDTRLQVRGQTAFKEEFVTCGGVALSQVDMRTMQSKVQPGFFLAGEILDIDGVTGGFNFQSCWTTGRLAGLGTTGAKQ